MVVSVKNRCACFIVLLLVCAYGNFFTASAQAGTVPLIPPDENSIPRDSTGDLIRLGQLYLTHTPRELPQYSGNSLRCTNCHLKAGTVAFSGPWVGVTTRYPRFSRRSNSDVNLAQRIQGCFMRSLNGKAPATDSSEMKAILAYMEWLSQGVVDGKQLYGIGMPRLAKTPPQPNRVRGEKLFQQRCSVCHGDKGQGRLTEKPQRHPYGFPPLWGEGGFNVAAGMARLHKAAAFIQRNMPFSAGGTLSIQQAYDVADFVIHQPRPDFPAKQFDWEQGGRPDDARY